MTIFAVVCAGMFPLIHVGRPWLGYWLFPYPNTMNVMASVPFAARVGRLRGLDLRDDLGGLLVHRNDPGLRHSARSRTASRWRSTSTACFRSAGAVRPVTGSVTRRHRSFWPVFQRRLVLSVHTVISFDFAVAALAGWHTTIFPPYFVAGAVYSGFAMVLTLAIPIRKWYHMEDLVTLRHLDNMAKVMLATGSIVGYGYGMEVFMSWYSASHWEFFMMWNRMFGPMGWAYWMLILTNLAIPLTTLWSRKLQRERRLPVRALVHRQYRYVV